LSFSLLSAEMICIFPYHHLSRIICICRSLIAHAQRCVRRLDLRYSAPFSIVVISVSISTSRDTLLRLISLLAPDATTGRDSLVSSFHASCAIATYEGGLKRRRRALIHEDTSALATCRCEEMIILRDQSNVLDLCDRTSV
jgi:hypothetical protein